MALAKIRFYSNNVLLPSPDQMSRGHEIIWSSNTGRSINPTDGAKMIGDVVAQKQTFQLHWGHLTQTEYNALVNALGTGFKPFRIVLGNETITVTAYRGTIAGTLGGYYGDEVWYSEASVDIIQQ